MLNHVMTDWKSFPAKRENVLLILHTVQKNNPQNYISDIELASVAEYLQMSLADLDGIVSFYSFFSRTARTKYVIRICDSLSCHIKGSQNLFKSLRTDNLFTIELVNCLGACDRAPNIMVNDKLYESMNLDKLETLIDKLRERDTDD